jgi:hypothetical protein
MASGDDLRRQVSALLQSPTCYRINFSLQGAVVDGPGLAEIGKLVAAKVIQVSVDPELNESGTYYYSLQEMSFRDGRAACGHNCP